MTARIIFDRSYAPCGFLIVPEGVDHRHPSARPIQTDWDYPGVASSMGFVPCDCGRTDGTIDCEHRTAAEMIGAALEYLEAHEGEPFTELTEYLE
jgi:hypothetical protein